MKRRNTVQILGVISIIILISVQVFILRGLWNQKDEMFNLRYRLISQDAVSSMYRRLSTDGFDTARYIISGYSAQAIKDISLIKNDSALAIKKKEILALVTKALTQEQYLSKYLSSYFERQGIDKNFTFKIAVNRFELIDNDTRIPIYLNEEFSNRNQPGTVNALPFAKKKPFSEILVKGDRSENNFYRLDFECYIDFSDKQKIILKESAASLALSTFSILVVLIIFMITYKNLMEEKRLSDLKTDFINNMTHELKTPLSTITVAGKTLEMEQIRTNESKILETAKLIGKQSIHLNQLINMILEISMWERTQFQLDKKLVSIEEIINDIVESFISGGGNGATINEKYNFSGTKVDLDIVYFTTLINNLLSNAVKYSDKVPVINIEGSALEDKIYIKISDNGIGINKTDQKHVFDKFYRASTGNIHKFKGLGLGLYYVKKIAEAHGGDVTVSSKTGKGSIFTVTLPNN
ncbi:MAG TPA: HAMP domain-containing sensor histidine kinase [Bacteroidales bacterium]|nr:HAMP domain-containing sensor histidine kinase [Bacteroidales bacterium]